MKYNPWRLLPKVLLASIILFLLANCKKNETGPLAEVITAEEVVLTPTIAISGGNILTDGGFPVTARGVCWSKKNKPSIKDSHTNDGSGTGSYISEITGLNIGVNYYVRAYATTEKGTAYGDEIVIRDHTGTEGTVTDYEENSYKTIGIGSQIWMAENLKSTRYMNGHYLSYPASNGTFWSLMSTGAYAWFDDDNSWKNIYGALYNWNAVSNAAGLCPEGWRIPGDDDWDKLMKYIGDNRSEAGKLLKSCRQVDSPLGGECNTSIHPRWDSHPIHHGTNQYKFDALPGGFRSFDGSYPNFLGSNGQWWSSVEAVNTNEAIAYSFSSSSSNLFRESHKKKFGFSVRCVKDN